MLGFPPVGRALNPSRMRALAGLVHPVPSLATVLVAAACMTLLGHGRPIGRLLAVSAVLVLQQFAISLHNDWCDRDLDSRAKPWRAIPAGVLRGETVLGVAWLMAGASVAASAPFGLDFVALDLAWLAAGFAYNAWLKRTAWSWLPFSVAFPLLPFFGSAAANVWPPGWPLVLLLAQPAVIAVHLADSLPDMEADGASDSGGLAWTLGDRNARRLATGGVLAAAVLLGASAYLAGQHSTGQPSMKLPSELLFTVARPEQVWPALAAGAAFVAGVTAAAVPALHRVAVTLGAASVGLGWIGYLAA